MKEQRGAATVSEASGDAPRTPVVLEISGRAAERVERGHLWIFSSDLAHKPPMIEPGSPAVFVHHKRFIGAGYFNPHSLISGRLLTRRQEIDLLTLLQERLSAAFARRELPHRGAARLVFSEADFLPGLIVDVYNDAAVVQSNTAGIDALMPVLEPLIPELFKARFHRELRAMVVQADAPIRRLEGVQDYLRVVSGERETLADIVFEEGDTLYVANLLQGQKTGFFLDQRHNRAAVARFLAGTKDKTVLDLFCYTGGWGLRALRSGAIHATFVDESQPALSLVRRAAEANAVPEHRTRVVPSDVFSFLESDKAMYDLVITDPPAFVKSKKNLSQAMRAYEKLNRLAWRRVRPGGYLFASSCSYHLSEAAFLDILRAGIGKERGIAHVVYEGTQAPDHPVLLAMPETQYLKCFALRKLHGR